MADAAGLLLSCLAPDGQTISLQQEKVVRAERDDIAQLDTLVAKIHSALLKAGGGFPRQLNVKPVRVKHGRKWPPTLKGMGSTTSLLQDHANGAALHAELPRPGRVLGPGIVGNWQYHQVLEGASRFDTRYEMDASNPIRSLDQLYSQATLLRPSLQCLILHLASKYKGMLPKKV